jgi:V8-like Glu-specific endopeptidase
MDGGGQPANSAQLSAGGQGRRPRRLAFFSRRQVLWTAALLVAAAVGGYALNPPAQAAGQGPGVRGRPFRGTAAVGALFRMVNGKPTRHFCTASVVHSPAQNVLLTAAHCVWKHAPPGKGTIAFAPGYHHGKFPHGLWPVTAVYVNRAWRQHRDPNNDVAFLIAGRKGDRIERHTGAVTLGIGLPAQKVQVIGYPDGTAEPVTCVSKARVFHANHHQLVWDCRGYPDGTSGGPFLARARHQTRYRTVMGVIGGYEEGGDTSAVSYSARFFSNVRTLYRQAATGAPPPS